jgi:hypothetical protein
MCFWIRIQIPINRKTNGYGSMKPKSDWSTWIPVRKAGLQLINISQFIQRKKWSANAFYFMKEILAQEHCIAKSSSTSLRPQIIHNTVPVCSASLVVLCITTSRSEFRILWVWSILYSTVCKASRQHGKSLHQRVNWCALHFVFVYGTSLRGSQFKSPTIPVWPNSCRGCVLYCMYLN